MAGLPLAPVHPERVCWGCDKYCPVSEMVCGNGTIRTAHPIEIFGPDWLAWAQENGIATEQARAEPEETMVACATTAPGPDSPR